MTDDAGKRRRQKKLPVRRAGLQILPGIYEGLLRPYLDAMNLDLELREELDKE